MSEQSFWYHGTTLSHLQAIMRDGFFRKGTYFGRHMEDAVNFGGPYVCIVAVRFDECPDWQATCINEIPFSWVKEVRKVDKVLELEIARMAVLEHYPDSRCVQRDGGFFIEYGSEVLSSWGSNKTRAWQDAENREGNRRRGQ